MLAFGVLGFHMCRPVIQETNEVNKGQKSAVDLTQTDLHTGKNAGEDEDPKAKDFVKSEGVVTFGDEFKYKENVFNEDIKIPTPLSKDNIIKFIEMIIEKSRSAVNGMTFIYGKGEKTY